MARPTRRINPRVEGLVKADYSGGTVYCKRTLHPVEEPFGQYALAWVLDSPAPKNLPGFLADAAGTIPKNWAFVDCETTGLSGGAGTMAFLIAVGRPVKKGFQIKQFFMPEPADERGLLVCGLSVVSTIIRYVCDASSSVSAAARSKHRTVTADCESGAPARLYARPHRRSSAFIRVTAVVGRARARSTTPAIPPTRGSPRSEHG